MALRNLDLCDRTDEMKQTERLTQHNYITLCNHRVSSAHSERTAAGTYGVRLYKA